VWQHLAGHVYAAHMTSDGTWGRPQPIDSTAEARSAQTGVVLHADGDATAYLERRVKNEDGLWGGQLAAVRYSKASDEWSEPVSLQRALWDEFFEVQMTGNARGDAVLVWSFRSLNSEEPREIYTASYDSSAGSWTEPDELTAITLNENAYPVWNGVVAMEDNGRTTVVCSHFEDGMNQVIAIPLDHAGAFGSLERLVSTEDAYVSHPAVVALEDGLMAVWWNDYDPEKFKMDSRILRDDAWQASESTRPMRERTSELRLAGVPDVGVLAYWVAENGITTSWHP